MKEGGEDRAAYRRAPGEGDKERVIALFSEIMSFFLSKKPIFIFELFWLQFLICAEFGLHFSCFLF
jgi:hypothetical protein